MYVAILIQSVMVCNEVVVDPDRKDGEMIFEDGEMIFVDDHRLCQPVATRFRRVSSFEWEC